MTHTNETATTPPWGKARFKLFFGAKGTVVRVVTILSSGSRERDAQCLAYCRKRVIPLQKKGVRTSAQWYILDIDAGAAIDMPPQSSDLQK